MNQPEDKWIDAAAQLPPLDPENSWVSLDGGGNKASIRVLVQTSDGEIMIANSEQYDDYPLQWVMDGRDSYLIEEGVAYWQPLPEPRNS